MRFSTLIVLSSFFVVNTATAANEYTSYESCMLDQMHKQKTEVGAMAITKICQTFPSENGGYMNFGSSQPEPSDEIEAIIEKKMKEAEVKRKAAEQLAADEASNNIPSPERTTKVAKEAPEVEAFITTYFEFPGTFTTNLMNSRKFVQVGIGVSTQYDESVMVNVESHQLALRSEILNSMSKFSEIDLQGEGGRQIMAAALRDSINAKLMLLEGFGGIEEVHFTSFILQ